MRAKPAEPVPDAPFAWFWGTVSPEIAAGDPARLDAALAQLQVSSAKLHPEWAVMEKLVQSFGVAAKKGASGTKVSPAMIMAVIAVESGGRATVTSSAGAQGVMQLMPATAARFNVSDSMDPAENIKGGTAYLEFLLRVFGEDPILALAAYNAGEGAVAKNKGVPPYKETRAYVPKVLAAWQVARQFCRIPPNAMTDPCAFSALTESDQNG